jgi:hypothetical protein
MASLHYVVHSKRVLNFGQAQGWEAGKILAEGVTPFDQKICVKW